VKPNSTAYFGLIKPWTHAHNRESTEVPIDAQFQIAHMSDQICSPGSAAFWYFVCNLKNINVISVGISHHRDSHPSTDRGSP